MGHKIVKICITDQEEPLYEDESNVDAVINDFVNLGYYVERDDNQEIILKPQNKNDYD